MSLLPLELREITFNDEIIIDGNVYRLSEVIYDKSYALYTITNNNMESMVLMWQNGDWILIERKKQ